MERSLLPSAVLLIFIKNRPSRPDHHLCKLFFCFFWNIVWKTHKKANEHSQLRGVLGRWLKLRWTVQLFMPVNDVEKWPFRQFFLEFWVQIGDKKKAVNDQPCKFQTRNKSLSKESKSICWLISECIRHRSSSFTIQIRFCLKAPVKPRRSNPAYLHARLVEIWPNLRLEVHRIRVISA